jgi:hypothetical protein
MDSLIHLFKLIAATVTFRIFTTPIFLRDRLLQTRTRFFPEKFKIRLKSNSLQEARKIAIFAIFPRSFVINSVLRCITALLEEGFEIVVVSNGDVPEDLLSSLLKAKHLTVLERRNWGRDFGAYKLGHAYIEKEVDGLKNRTVMLLNDSVVWFEISKIRKFLHKFVLIQAPWKSLFVNYQFHQHAQSFCVSFGSSITNSTFYWDFWRQYRPSSFRHVTINKGEVRLSQVLLSKGYTPHALVDHNFIGSDVLPHTGKLHRFELHPSIRFEVFNHLSLKIERNRNLLLDLIVERLYSENPTHHLGAFLSYRAGIPLKLDIVKTGHLNFLDLERILNLHIESSQEISDIMEVFKRTGTHASKRGFIRLWSQFGYV